MKPDSVGAAISGVIIDSVLIGAFTIESGSVERACCEDRRIGEATEFDNSHDKAGLSAFIACYPGEVRGATAKAIWRGSESSD